ncbi:N66 matrix protein-like [Helianthus annuus]|uniref:N66 matrix protein-like n=1 Tax=Helianthus annuus TaxID=4232 RepID=UPI000B8F130E|nr:N66 matrix protein-like [Helianthus annuus]
MKRDTNPPEEAKTFAAANDTVARRYQGTLPKCQKCRYHHEGACRIPRCEKCGRLGQQTEDCWGKGNGGANRNGRDNRNGNGNRNGAGNGNNGGNGNGNGNRNGNGAGQNQGCFDCGNKDHFKKDCPRENNAQGRAFVI